MRLTFFITESITSTSSRHENKIHNAPIGIQICCTLLYASRRNETKRNERPSTLNAAYLATADRRDDGHFLAALELIGAHLLVIDHALVHAPL